jgi:hypothetical protein
LLKLESYVQYNNSVAAINIDIAGPNAGLALRGLHVDIAYIILLIRETAQNAYALPAMGDIHIVLA